MDVYFRRVSTNTDSKTDIAAAMSIEYSAMSADGRLDVSSSR